MISRNIIILLVIIVFITIPIVIYIVNKNSSKPGPTPGPTPGPKPTSSDPVMSYLYALYPQINNSSLTKVQATTLYDSLMWYYFPLVRTIDSSRQGPLKGPYADSETEWFMADGTDCGDPTDPTDPGTFTCSVFGGACNTWEFGKPNDGGRPYQYAAFIKPYGMRNGTPSNSYIESVAFVCEALGRMLLSPTCGFAAPSWSDFIAAEKKEGFEIPNRAMLGSDSSLNCPNKTTCDVQNPTTKAWSHNQAGCTVTSSGNTDVCCWDSTNNKADDSVCPFPAQCMATQDTPGGPVFGNYCSIPCGYVGCDASSNSCTWNIDNKKWEDYFADMPGGSTSQESVKSELQKTASPSINGQKPTARSDKSVQKTMFYWCKGYGKFLNMGNTGVYFSYEHFILTCPKLAKDGKTSLRWSYPQILQTATLDGGNSAMMNQLLALIGNDQLDTRQYLEGYVTTLRGKQYEGGDGIQVSNKMLYNTGNVSGLVNPLDDDNLVEVDKRTITKYYDPSKKIKNPQYNKPIKFAVMDAIYLQQGMIIYGATGSSTENPRVGMTCGKGCGTFPFGNFFRGANIGGCVYKMIDMLGWKSAQFTMMPTGAGGAKYCNSPEYDYEIVYIADKNAVCKTEMVMLDPTVDLDNYTKNGFVDGNKYTPKQLNVTPFNATVMSLTERNVPLDWTGPRPNAMLYKQPATPIPFKFECPYKDQVFSKYPNGF